jgi:hypothetical protein
MKNRYITKICITSNIMGINNILFIGSCSFRKTHQNKSIGLCDAVVVKNPTTATRIHLFRISWDFSINFNIHFTVKRKGLKHRYIPDGG